MEVEQPVSCRYASAFHFHATLTGMYGSTLIRDEVIQVGQPRQKRLLTASWMMDPFIANNFRSMALWA